MTATIKAIDPATRSVTLRSENGDEDTFTVGPAVTRFDQLKVGDTIKATYYESLVFEVRKPGAPTVPSGTAARGGTDEGCSRRGHREAADDDRDGQGRRHERAVDHGHDG